MGDEDSERLAATIAKANAEAFKAVVEAAQAHHPPEARRLDRWIAAAFAAGLIAWAGMLWRTTTVAVPKILVEQAKTRSELSGAVQRFESLAVSLTERLERHEMESSVARARHEGEDWHNRAGDEIHRLQGRMDRIVDSHARTNDEVRDLGKEITDMRNRAAAIPRLSNSPPEKLRRDANDGR